MAKRNQSPLENDKNSDSKELSITDIKIPKDFEKKIKAKFGKLKKVEVSFTQYLKMEKEEFKRSELLRLRPDVKYTPIPKRGMTACGNGNFEPGLDINQWQGAYGDVRNIPSSFIEGFIRGPINSSSSHQTEVNTGTDPNVPISTTAPSSTGAVRLGNSINGYGAELISKTFVVTPAERTIIFWYATVMQNPIGHPPNEQPLFWVRVTDASGAIVPGAFDFGNGSDKLIADQNNPFFKKKGQLVYKDWSCAQIDLSSQIGKQVTIEFVTGDCGYGGHWGYAYLDRYCGTCKGSPTGTLEYDCEGSDHCGKGQICFDYTLPHTDDDNGTTITGSVDIKLDIYQNGNLVTSLASPTLSAGNQYCFQIDPAAIFGINLSLGGFDFVATGEFSINSISLPRKKIGIAPDGITREQNNDYQIECKSCKDINEKQEKYLKSVYGSKVNKLESYNCNCPDTKDKESCGCTKSRPDQKPVCEKVRLPKMEPCISISWGDSDCDCMETSDFEIACISVCNCFENVVFENFKINRIEVTDEFGKPVDTLPNGKPSVQVVPSGPICFGDIASCSKGKPSCKSRELVIKTVGAKPGKYRLKLLGVCYETRFVHQKDYCIDLNLCGD